LGCPHTAVHNLNTLFSLKLKIVGGWNIHASKCGVHEIIGWEICIAFFADTSLSLSVYCAVVVSYKTFVLSARESIPVRSRCMTVPNSVWPVVLTHTCSVPRPAMGFTTPHVPDFSVCDCHVFQPSREH